MATDDAKGPGSRRPSSMVRFMLHACIALVVVLLPPVVCDAIGTSSFREIEWLRFSGGIAYPLYALYWIAKLKSARSRFMGLHLIVVLTLVFFAAVASDRSTPMLVPLLPTLGAALPLLGAVASWRSGRSEVAATRLVSSLAALLIAVPSSLLLFYGMAMSSAGLIRY